MTREVVVARGDLLVGQALDRVQHGSVAPGLAGDRVGEPGETSGSVKTVVAPVAPHCVDEALELRALGSASGESPASAICPSP